MVGLRVLLLVGIYIFLVEASDTACFSYPEFDYLFFFCWVADL